MTTKLATALPDTNHNGLHAINAALISAPETTHLVIAAVDCSRITTDTDTGDVVPTVRIRHIEAVRDADAATVDKLLTATCEGRTGRKPLPFDD